MLTYLTLDRVQVGQSCVLDLALLEMRPLVAVAKLTQLSGYTDPTRPILGGFCENRGLLQSTDVYSLAHWRPGHFQKCLLEAS